MPNPNTNEYRQRVGLDSLYIALVTQDDAAGYAAGTPEYLAPAGEATASPTVNIETSYFDDKPYDTHSSEAETPVEVTVSNLPEEVAAYLNGDTFDAASGRVFDTADPTLAPYFALGFRSKKSNGSYRYYWYLKGRFTKPSEEFATQGETPDPKTQSVTFTALKTVHEFDVDGVNNRSVKRVKGDEDTTNFDATGWFTQVQTPSVTAADALALSSSVPVDEDTDIAIAADITLTFNNPLVAGAINNVVLFDDSTLTVVGATVTLSTSRLVLTINPTASLSNNTDYTVLYAGVTDIYGQTLAGQVNFTTIAA
jgi:phi13 family phage major tail protein